MTITMFLFIVFTSIIGSCIIAFIIGTILGVFCGVKYKQKSVRSTTSKENTSTREENSALSIKGPIYEELELEDKTATIDLSQNIAYECVKKT